MPPETVAKRQRLIVSIHDVGPRSEAAVDQLLDLLSRHVPREKVAMLAVPNHWGEAPIIAGSPFATKLRDWAQAGHEIFLHGWFHKDQCVHESRAAQLKAKHMTAGEGEFLGLDLATATQRMRDGKALLEDVMGLPTAGFIAPAWLYGDGAMQAMAQLGFPLAEDHWKVWSPAQADRVLCRGPVITWASRSRARIASSLFAAAVLPPVLKLYPVARVAVHPGDVTVPALLRSIDMCVGKLARARQAIRYRDL